MPWVGVRFLTWDSFSIRSFPYSTKSSEWRLSGPNLKLALCPLPIHILFRNPLFPGRAARLVTSMASGTQDIQERRILLSRTHTDEGLALVMEHESDLTPLEDEIEAPKKHPQTREKNATLKNVAVEGSKSRNTSGARKRTTSQAVRNTVTDSEVSPKKRKRACKSEPVYIIPDVEKKATTFRGRLGTKYVFCLIFT